MTTPTLIAGSTGLGWSNGGAGNASNEFIASETTTFPVLAAIQALDPSLNPAIVLAVSCLSTGQGTAAGATATIGGYPAQIIASCGPDVTGGSGAFVNVALVVLPVTAAMSFADATVVVTIPGMASGGGPYVYGGTIQLALYNNVNPTSNLGWAGGYAAGTGAPLTSIPISAAANDLLVAAWSSTTLAGNGLYAISNPTSDFTNSVASGYAGVSTGFGAAGTSTAATAAFAGGPFPTATGIVGVLVSGALPASIPNLENLSEAIAKEVLISAGFVLGLVTYVPSVLVIPGNVVTQLPVAGTQANGGTPVSVALSQGRIAVPVPDLIGLTEAEAIAALENLGLVPGAIGVTASTTVAAGIVISQNIGPGIPYPIIIAVGSLVGFVVSSGPPSTSTLFDYEPTVISQYANSPTLLQWIDNMNQYMDQSTNFANFLSYVWNVDSAVGFGLDIWGKIVNVSRLLRIPNSTPYVGFDISSESQPDQDWTPAGSNQPPYNNPPVGGAFYTGHNATEAYLLDDNSYRQLILAKAFANICSTTAPAINQILQNLYGAGQAYVLSSGVMAITYNFNFTPSPIQLAILTQSGVIPTPPGVAFSIVTP